MTKGQNSAGIHKGKKMFVCLGLILLLTLGAVAWWSLIPSNAQTNSGGEAEPSQSSQSVTVLLKTRSGSIVTSSVEPPSPQTVSHLDKLLQRYPGTWRADIHNGVVENLKPTTPILVTSSAKDFSLSLLSEFSNLFGIGSEETEYLLEFNLRQRRVVEYRQVIDGIPVEYSFITFSVDASQLEQVTSRLYPDVGRNLNSVIPFLKKQAAFDIAFSSFKDNLRGSVSPKVNYKGNLVVLPEGSDYFLTWKVVVEASGSLDSYTFYIDANTGRVIKKFSNVESQQNANPAQEPTALNSQEEASAVLRKRLPATERTRTEKESREKNENETTETKAPSQSVPLQPGSTWQTILSENFDTLEFPYSPWRVFDNNGATGGDLYWDDQNCVSHDPSWSLWAADGGANRLNACVDNYASDMDSWVVYGPFDLSNSTDGLLDFHYNNVSELNYDYFKWMASVDGTHFSGYQVSGNSNGWQYQSLDFKNVPTLGNITGRSQVWIAFIFASDSTVVSGKGAFVDDVAIKRLLSSSCTGVSGHVGGHIYGKNQNELQLKDFKNMKVVLNNSFAFDSHTVTNSVGNYSSSECSDYIRFELEGFGSSNFLKVHDCNNGTCSGGDLLTSQDFPFASQVNFDWDVDADNKKEVNVFWHVNEIHDWYRGLLGQDLMNYQMQAYVDYDDPQCPNAFYRDSDKNIYFCPFTDYARESDVIYHEYTHGIVHHIPNYALPYQDESGSMDEGFADYFAAAKNNDPSIGEGVGTIRTITDVVNYGNQCTREAGSCAVDQYWLRSTSPDPNRNDYGYVHHNSLVASGSLWNLRQNQGLSGSYVDKLVLDTLILRKPLTFAELLNGLVGQDGGSHETQIRAAFATRGVSTGSNITVGQGAPNPQLFIDAFNRSGFSQFVTLPPINTVHRWDCSSCDPSNSSWGKGMIQDFNGTTPGVHDALMVADTNTTFVAQIYGGIWDKFIQLGDLNYNSVNTRMLGYPIADRNCSDYNAQCFTDAQLVSPFGTSYHYQRFQGGALVLHKSGARINQTYEVHGAIRARWQVLGGPSSGTYGLPISDEYAYQSKRRSDFEGGSICFNPSTNQTEDGCVSTITYTITVSALPGAGGTVSGGGTFAGGSSRTVTASANSGYTFSNWTENGSAVSSSASYTFTLNSNRNLVANFTATPVIAQMTSPANGSTFSSTSVTFNWSLGSGNSQFFLYVGNSPGSSEYFSNQITGGSTTVGGFPTDNRSIYVTLWSLNNGQWLHNDYNYKACNNCSSPIAQMTSPANGSTFTSTNVTFNWSLGIGNSQYYMSVGSSPGNSEYFSNYITGGSTMMGGLPTDNRSIYVTLWSLNNGQWLHNDYNYKACNNCSSPIAQITSPTNGSTFSSTIVTFNWSLGSGNSQYYLYVGNSPGSSEYFSNYITGGSTSVGGLPTDNRSIYVTLWSLNNGQWLHNDYNYKACNNCTSPIAQITSPANGSTFSSIGVTFNWSLGSGNSQYFLYVGNSPGSSEYFSNYITGGSTTVGGLPTDNRTIYVTLWSLNNGQWLHNDYTYKACNNCSSPIAQMTSPANGSTFSSRTVTFNWSLGSGNSQYHLYVGNSPGSSEFFSNQITGGSTTVVGLPTDNRTIYVTLWSLNSGQWLHNDYNYKACNNCSSLVEQLVGQTGDWKVSSWFMIREPSFPQSEAFGDSCH